MASEAEHAAVIVEGDTLQAAVAVRATVLDLMYEIAVDAACRQFGRSQPQTR